MIVLEEEIQHHQRNYNNLIKEQERLLKDKAEQDQRLQREIQERLGLKMVRIKELDQECFFLDFCMLHIDSLSIQ